MVKSRINQCSMERAEAHKSELEHKDTNVPIITIIRAIHRQIESRRWNNRTKSLLMSDVDRTWRYSDLPDTGESVLNDIGVLSPTQASSVIQSRLGELHDREIDLSLQLERVGLAVGRLTPNKAVPSGVYGVWRSAFPILLINDRLQSERKITHDIAQQIGFLVYGEALDESGEFKANLFADDLVRPDITA